MPIDIAEKVRLILSHAKEEPLYVDPTGKSINTRATLPIKVIYGPNETILHDECVDLLRALLASLQENEHPTFISSLLSESSPRSIATATHVLLELKAFDSVEQVLMGQDIDLARGCLRAVLEKLVHESSQFSDDNLLSIRALLPDSGFGRDSKGQSALAVLQAYEIANQILHAIERIQYLRLKRDIVEGANPEINTDQRAVAARAAKLGFSRQLSDAIDTVDSKLRCATTGFEFKGCLDLVRTVLEEFVEESCKIIEAHCGTPVPANPKQRHYQPYLQYLINAGLILENEWESLQKFYGLLSNEGSHSLEAEIEQAKVYKNITIEWLLLLSGRITQYLK